MKRLFAVLLRFSLMLACFPAAVFADDAGAYDLWIGKVQLTSENTEGEGWSYSGNGEACAT